MSRTFAARLEHGAVLADAGDGGLGVGDHDVYGKLGRARPDERVVLAAEEGVPPGCGDGFGLVAGTHEAQDFSVRHGHADVRAHARPDQPGQIGQIGSILGQHGVNISDIKITSQGDVLLLRFLLYVPQTLNFNQVTTEVASLSGVFAVTRET